MTSHDLTPHLRALAEALPAGSAVPVPREMLLALLDAQDVTPLSAAPEPTERAEDRLLTVQEAAQALSVTPQWIYRHADDWTFTRRLGRRTLRFSEGGLRAYLAEQRAA